jgi:hypothetical protein
MRHGRMPVAVTAGLLVLAAGILAGPAALLMRLLTAGVAPPARSTSMPTGHTTSGSWAVLAALVVANVAAAFVVGAAVLRRRRPASPDAPRKWRR